GLAKKCRSSFEKAVALDSKNIAARMDLFEFYVQAPGIAGGGKDKAREQAAEIMKLDVVRGHLALAAMAMATEEKDLKTAEAEYRAALTAEPKSARARVALGNFLLNQKRFPEAKALFDEALPDPKLSMIAHYQLGKVLLVSGTDLDAALAHFKTYLSAPPEPETPAWADAHWRIGLVYEKQGKKPEAIAELKEALKLNPAHVQAKKDLKRLGG
ncbi:MAG TPA: tetratricopeptide repeat protein, partial [Thermoanaerobaculia bacterium]|nr:tetratricopeptide repeat protein [Thermoanaerobaculia bacterium]